MSIEKKGKTRLWHEYLSLLNHLRDIVQKQNTLLKEDNWDEMRGIYARKETSILALQRTWQKLTEGNRRDGVHPDDANGYREKARSLILLIREIERDNEAMINEAMGKIKGNIGQLKNSRKKLIHYLESEKRGAKSSFSKIS